MARPKKLPDGMWLRGKTYYARFRAGGRLVRQKLSTDYRVACELLTELKARANRADFGLMDNAYPWDTLKAEFLRWAKQSVKGPGAYERDLRFFEEYRKPRTIREIDHEYVFGFREWRLSGGGCKPGRSVTPRTINRQVGTLNNMLNRAVAWDRIAENPIDDVKPLRHDTPKKQRRSLSLEEVQSIFDHSPTFLKPVWRMLMTTGIRKGELIELRFSDIDFDRKSVTIRANVAKSKKAREIPLDDAMLDELTLLRAESKARRPVKGDTAERTERQRNAFSRDHVFVSRANTPLKNNLLARFYHVCEKAGIDDAHPGGSVDIHSLRVSFTTLTLEHGASPKAVQAILGHSTLALTMGVYARATEKAKREAIGTLPFARASAPDHIISLPSVRAARTSSPDSPETIELKRVTNGT